MCAKNYECKVDGIIAEILEEIKKYAPVKVILFGSRARGDHRKNSDIDIAVDLELPFREKRKLKERIESISGIYSVDLIFLPELNEDFRKKILSEGKVLYEKK